ncbi:Tyrosine--tRNA ligase [Mycena kentingensis (nom. inval.)]|nr:Tyrosine--tRNA ligase [Mycena kentingensis (nom. inval.)]
MADEKFEIITRSLQEVLGGDSIKAILAEGRSPKGYFGADGHHGSTSHRLLCPTHKNIRLSASWRGDDHPVCWSALFFHLCQRFSTGSDIHAFLDNMKAPYELVEYRVKYYQALLTAVFKSLGISTSKLTYKKGSDYQLTSKFNMDNYRLCATVTEHDAKKAGAEVVKQVDSALLSGLLYPGLQALDEEYLGVDFQFGGVDQRKIFTFAELYLPRLGYAKRAHLMNAMVPGLAGGKMSSSDPNSKIDFLDSADAVRKKIKLAFCEEGNVEENGILSFVKAVLIPISKLRLENIARGGAILEEKLEPFVAAGINKLLDPIRKAFEEDKEWQEIEKLAYPDPNAKVKKVKKEKVYHPPPPGKGKNVSKDGGNPPGPEAAPVA